MFTIIAKLTNTPPTHPTNVIFVCPIALLFSLIVAYNVDQTKSGMLKNNTIPTINNK